MRLVPALIGLALAGCVVVARPYPRPMPPPPGPPPAEAPAAGPVTEQQAVEIATEFARSRGVQVDQVRQVRLDGRGRYHVTLAGAGGRDRARVLVDAASGQVLRAKIKDTDRYDDD
ncbi:MAG TPA: PepSY domain-containing protein [Anaeromyxobacteraceae bacterium]|jgi:hypothetical protein